MKAINQLLEVNQMGILTLVYATIDIELVSKQQDSVIFLASHAQNCLNFAYRRAKILHMVMRNCCTLWCKIIAHCRAKLLHIYVQQKIILHIYVQFTYLVHIM